jgi:hypothetical protein
MGSYSIVGKIIRFDPVNNEYTIKADFFSIESQHALEECIEQRIKHTFKTNPQRRVFTEDNEQREAIFPTISYERAGKMKYRPKRMSECSYTEMQKNIEILHKRHRHLKINDRPIDFSNLKLK